MSDSLPTILKKNPSLIYEYDEIKLGNGTPNLDEFGIQKVLEDRGNVPKKWVGAKEWDVPLRNKDGAIQFDKKGNPKETDYRILTLHDSDGNITKMGYVIEHKYKNIRTFPKPWFQDGGK